MFGIASLNSFSGRLALAINSPDRQTIRLGASSCCLLVQTAATFLWPLIFMPLVRHGIEVRSEIKHKFGS
jgi:hypothetical protein